MSTTVQSQAVHLSRRALIASAGCVAGSKVLSAPSVWATQSETRHGNASVYHFSIGDVRTSAICDGQVEFPAWPTYAPDVEREPVYAQMRKRYLSPPNSLLDANALVLEVGTACILVDTGLGSFRPEVGALTGTMHSIGLDPVEIDIVVLSHVHPDHVGGLKSKSGELNFPNAPFLVFRSELEQWRDAPDFGAMTLHDSFKPVFVNASRAVFDLGRRLTAIDVGAGFAPGISLFALPGHTTGYCGVRITSQDE